MAPRSVTLLANREAVLSGYPGGKGVSDPSESAVLDRRTSELIRDSAIELTSLSGYLMNDAGKGDVRTLLVTSSRPGEGKTTAAVGIASTLAGHIHSRVVLLDANFRAPRLHELYGVQAAPGLGDVLVGGSSWRPALHRTEQEDLQILAAGSGLTGSIGRCEVGVLRQTLADLQGEFDYVVVDGSQYLNSSDVSLISPLFDGIVFVIECEKTNWEVVQQATEGLRKSGGRLLGAVLNKRRYYIPGMLYGKV